MNKPSVKPGNQITMGKPISSRGRMRAGKNFLSGNEASSNRSMNRAAQANSYLCIASDIKVESNVRCSKFINLYGCKAGDDKNNGAFVEIQKRAKVDLQCKTSSHTFICEGMTTDDEAFVSGYTWGKREKEYISPADCLVGRRVD